VISSNNILVVIAGPTAVGKTDISFSLAIQTNGEIIYADSTALYKELILGSARPTDEMQKMIPHYMIGELSVRDEVSVALYQKIALSYLDNIFSRQKIAIMCGGSGLYIRSIIDDIVFPPGPSTEIRQKLRFEANEKGLDYVYGKLMEIDPESCKRISSQDIKRTIRALEVYYLTGIPFSVLTKNWNVTRSGFTLHYYVIDRSDEEIKERISRRTDEMVKDGLVEEVQELKKLGLDETLACRQSIGYKEVIGYLDGDIDFGDMIELIKNNTMKLVKKQRKWFRSDKRAKWLLLDKDFVQEDAVALIISEINSGGGKI